MLLLLLTVGWVRTADGAGVSPGFLLKNWTTGDGVPHNTVRAIVGSREGYLWLGTANGLARFDGVRFVTFDRVNSPTMEEDDIFSLHEDRKGTLWYRTRRGVGRLRDGRFAFHVFANEGPYVLHEAFTEDRQGTLWIRGRDGFARLSGDDWEDVPLPEGGPRSVIHACAAREGGLWIAAEDGLWQLDGGRATRVKEVSGLNRLAVGTDGRVWVLVGGSALYEFHEDRWTRVTGLESEDFSRLFAAANGDVWIAAENRNRVACWRANQMTVLNEDQGLEGNRVLAFHHDTDGNVWMGLNAGGLYQLRDRQVRVFNRSDGLLGLNAASLAQMADGTIMLNVMGSTLHRFDEGRFVPVDVQTSAEVFEDPTAIVPATAGGVWAGTFWGTLARIVNGREVERIGATTGTRSLLVDREGNLWRGTRTAGIEVFSGTNVLRYSTANGLSHDNVYCFAQDQSGAVWAGTEDGLNRIQDGDVVRYSEAAGLRHPFVSALWVDSRGTLWAGTLGGGLSGWNGSRFVTLTTREGLAHNSVEQLLEDDRGHLWLGTRIGLMRISLDQLHEFLASNRTAITGTVLGEEEGISGPNFWTEYQPASLRSNDGRLWFCTGRGVVAIDPNQFAATTAPPLVHIEAVKVNGETASMEADKDVPVPPDHDRVEIGYTGISLSRPEQVRFRYRLEGYDRDWVDAGRSRFASYSHLPPGRYRFEVGAVNNEGVWSDGEASIALMVQRAYWQTFWFRGLMIACALGLATAFYRRRVRGLERQREVQEAFSRRLIESQENERKRIAAELHDSLGQNLLVVRNLALMAVENRSVDSPAVREFREISDTAGQALDEVRSISHALRPVELDRLGLTRSIQENVRRVREASEVRIDLQLDDIDGALPPDQQINFYRIVQECLTNIVKHSHACTGTVEVQADTREIRLIIADDGRGFSPTPPESQADPAHGLGLVGIIERARALGGVADIRSRPGDGTRVEVRVPRA